MKFPWANTLLLALILVELASGFRPRFGFAWSFAGPFVLAWFSGVSWHIYAGAAMVPVLVWHTFHHTRGFPVSFWAERRSFLRLSALSLAGLAFWQVGETATVMGGLSGARRRFTGSYRSKASPDGVFPVVSWLNDRPPIVDDNGWAMTVGGAVERDTVLRYGELVPSLGLAATLDCTGGWFSEQVWGGAPVARLLDQTGIAPDARSVTFTSLTGYYRRFSLAEARGYLLATHVGGRPLAPGHGFPARLVAPGKRGFEWVKWVGRIEVGRSPKWLQPPLPLQ